MRLFSPLNIFRVSSIALGALLATSLAHSQTTGLGSTVTLVSSGLNGPSGVAVDGSGNVYIADLGNKAIKEWVASTQQVTTLVSTGLSGPIGVAVDGSGNVYIADYVTGAISAWSASTHQATTLVSSGLNEPSGVAVDNSGNVYIADTSNNAIKEWNASTQQVTTLVSSGLSHPKGVAVDGSGNVYIADTSNNAIKEWSASTQQVTTLVSSGLNGPSGVAVDKYGYVYIADQSNDAIKQWGPLTQQVTTLVFSGLYYPSGVAVDSNGYVYIADYNDNAIKELPYANWSFLLTGISVVPSSVLSEGGAFTLTVNGYGFAPWDVVLWNGAALPTTYVNSSQLTAMVSGSLISSAETAQVAVSSPAGLVVSQSGTWETGEASNLPFNAPGESWSYEFLMPANPTVSSFTAGTNFSVNFANFVGGNGSFLYTLNGAPVSITPGYVEFLSASAGGGMLLSFSSGSAPFTLVVGHSSEDGLFYSGPESAPTILPGTYPAGVSGSNTSEGYYSEAASLTIAPQAAQTSASVPFTVNTPGATPAPQTITFGAPGNVPFGVAPFTIIATASSGLTLSFTSSTTSVCTVSGNTVTILAAGTCSITASQAGNASYAAATPVAQGFTVTPASQTITFSALGNMSIGAAPFTVTATASSGLAVSFASTRTSVCTVSGATVTLVADGPCTIQATQAGNGDWAAATPVDQSFLVVGFALSPSSAAAGGGDFTLTVDGSGFTPWDTVSWNGAALSTNYVNANQLTATVIASLISSPETAQIAVFNPDGMVFSESGVWGSATPSTPLSGPGASWSYSFLMPANPVVSSSMPGFYFIVTLANLTGGIGSFRYTLNGTPFGITQGSAEFFEKTNSEGGMSLTFEADNTTATFGVAQPPRNPPQLYINSESTPTIFAGTYAGLTSASVAGAGLELGQDTGLTISPLSAQTTLNLTFTVSGAAASQTITFGALSNVTLGVAPFTVSATASSGLAVSFASTTTSVCTVSGSTVTVVALGTCSITASQAGNASYAVATPVTQSFTVNAAVATSNTLSAASTMVAPGAAFSVPITLSLVSGTTVDALTFAIQITPNGGAPALTGSLGFTPASSIADTPFTTTGGTANAISVLWSSLSTALSGTSMVGTVNGTIPAGAASGQSYTVVVTGASAATGTNGATPVPVSAGANGAINVAFTYLVGDVAPYTSDTAPNFGDGILNILDLVQQLFAVNGVPGFRPAACSDRFDAMDTFPLDTTSTRGGDGALDIRDLIEELFRVNNLDTSRPVRASRGGVCASESSESSLGPTDASRKSAAVRIEAPLEGVLTLGGPERGSEGEERIPVYLEARSNLVQVAVTFALGDQRSQLHFVATAETPPSLTQDGQLGVVAAVWLNGINLPAGGRLLLGYVEGPAGVSANLKVYGVSASGLGDNREVRLEAPTEAGAGR